MDRPALFWKSAEAQKLRDQIDVNDIITLEEAFAGTGEWSRVKFPVIKSFL